MHGVLAAGCVSIRRSYIDFLDRQPSLVADEGFRHVQHTEEEAWRRNRR